MLPLEDLMQHPYIGKKMGLIIDSRRQAEPIKDTNDLKNVPGMDIKRLRKLVPYLAF
jgi:DNA uptake protein ComE-like DNA-binding protein